MKRRLLSTMLCALALLLLMGAGVEPSSSEAILIEKESTVTQNEEVLETGEETGMEEIAEEHGSEEVVIEEGTELYIKQSGTQIEISEDEVLIRYKIENILN